MTNNDLKLQFQKEKDDEKNRNKERYKRVVDQRQECNDLKDKIRNEESTLRMMERSSSYSRSDENHQRNYISGLENSLKQKEKFTEKIYHPLSYNDEKSKFTLFFYYIPNLLNKLCKTGFSCYFEFFEQKDILKSSLDFITFHSYFYNKSKTSQQFQGNVTFYEMTPPEDIYRIYSDTNGTWHPSEDINGLELLLKKDEKYYNPYIFDKEKARVLFTENISNSKLQDLMIMKEYEGVSQLRGNFCYANFDMKPFNFTKSEYESFCSTRSFPLQSLQKILADLKEGKVKLSNEDVHIMLKQTVYQLGPLINEDYTLKSLKWKLDLFDQQFIQIFYNTLDHYADNIKETPQNYQDLLILSEITSYLSQFHKFFLDIRNKLAKIAEKWANDLEGHIIKCQNDGDHITKAKVTSKQHTFIGYSILTYLIGDLKDEDIERLCSLILRFHKTKPLLSDDVDSKETLFNKVNRCIAKRFQEIIPKMKDSYLSKATKLILPNVEVENLKWTKNEKYAYFFSETKERNYIHINLANGIVLFNGNPPYNLPFDIVEHPLYKDIFGERNCTVLSDNNGGLMTDFPILKRNYLFLKKKDVLIIKEFLEKDQEGSPTNYQLLNHLKVEQWGKGLPEILKKGYSYWYSKIDSSISIIVFRNKSFKDHRIHFILYQKDNEKNIFKVPLEYTEKSVGFLMSKMGVLERILAFDEYITNNLFKVLSKFENKEFIHLYKTPKGNLKIDLVRFDLQFEYDGDVFRSLNYSGYGLRLSQTLSGTFYGFSQYLLLDLIKKDSCENIGQDITKILVPKGTVVDKKIVVPKSFDDKIQVSVFKIHPRFNTINANTIEERLQLATILLATDSLLFDSRFNMTSSEMALELLRQCWKNTPFSQGELLMLKNASEYHQIQSSVALLCHNLFEHSRSLSLNKTKEKEITIIENKDAKNAYRSRNPLLPLNFRNLLTYQEEEKELGGYIEKIKVSPSKVNILLITKNPEKVRSLLSSLKELEYSLDDHIEKSTPQDEKFPSFNDNDELKKAIAKKYLQELEASWKTHHSLENIKVKDFKALEKSVQYISTTVKEIIQTLENEISRMIEVKEPNQKLLKMANEIPRVTGRDLLNSLINQKICFILIEV